MAALDSEPFGEPTLLLNTNDTMTFTSDGLLGTGMSDGSGDSGAGENAPSMQSPPWAARPDDIGSADDDESSTFMSDGILDGPTQVTSTIISSDHLCGLFEAHLRFRAPRSNLFGAPKCAREPLFRLANSGWICLHPDFWAVVRHRLRWSFDPSNDIRRKTRLYQEGGTVR